MKIDRPKPVRWCSAWSTPINVQNQGCLFSWVMPKLAAQYPLARSTVMWMAKSINATNQNCGAMIRISAIATARCTRQWASSGSAQPCFWSLPIAIQEVCRTKSAMTCLRVSSSIHPISAPTGTDDDMVGNNKADALTRTDLERHGQTGGLQRNFFLNPDNSTGIGLL